MLVMFICKALQENLCKSKDFLNRAGEFLLKINIMQTRSSTIASSVLIWFSACSFLLVGAMAFYNPQSVMDLVNVRLSGPDSYSSIRGVYGGVGFSLFFSLIYLVKHHKKMALALLTMIWGFYAFSRCFTILADGPLGKFGSTWLLLETFLFISSLVLWLLSHSEKYKPASIMG
jgi:hypothetical protein